MGTLELSKISFKRNGATTIREMADEYKKQISRPNQTIGTIIQDLIYFKKNNHKYINQSNNDIIYM